MKKNILQLLLRYSIEEILQKGCEKAGCDENNPCFGGMEGFVYQTCIEESRKLEERDFEKELSFLRG